MLCVTAVNGINDQHIWSQIETLQESTRVVFLGASNLSRSFPTAVNVARDVLRTRLMIHAAMGPGRSYGKESGFMGKKISGIFFSRLWDEYSAHECSRTIAFVTDIGNDLAYGEPPERITVWVAACVERLVQARAEVVLTNVPIGVLRRLSRTRFELFRALLFPRCPLPWTTLLDRAEELHQRLADLSENRNMPIFTVPNAWYGFDPIHPRSAQLANYWRAMFAHVMKSDCPRGRLNTPLRTYWRLRTLSTPDVRWKATSRRFSLTRATLADGSRVVLY